ncbi:OmpA family protein [Tropicibacter sp. R15_0]|uniref:OmpA family protein n=1 Tax=Tropicibacter sp. R15_0 TaxID=2821101 RepID=UPI001ADC4376|nr:OmpA family protein [Tropicibacter sp. R15_0]MBO9465423.1 OmpA family protein [Tropicibacter sp. R15_0]
MLKKTLITSALCLGLPLVAPMAAQAQSGEIFIPGAGDALPEIKAKPTNPLARCMFDASAANCADIGRDDSGVQFESAVAPQYETLVLDLNDHKVAISTEPPAKPPVYDAPPAPVHKDPKKAPDYTAKPSHDPNYAAGHTPPPAHDPYAGGKIALPSVAISIEFDYNSDHIRADQLGKLTQLVAALQDPALSGTPYAVIGHTDSAGSEGYNCDLSLRRAASVTRALESSYVQLPLYPVGFGEYVLKNEYNPKAPENRRVTFLRLPDHPGTVLQTANAVCHY